MRLAQVHPGSRKSSEFKDAESSVGCPPLPSPAFVPAVFSTVRSQPVRGHEYVVRVLCYLSCARGFSKKPKGLQTLSLMIASKPPSMQRMTLWACSTSIKSPPIQFLPHAARHLVQISPNRTYAMAQPYLAALLAVESLGP